MLAAKNEELSLAKEEIADLRFEILEKEFNMSVDRMKVVEQSIQDQQGGPCPPHPGQFHYGFSMVIPVGLFFHAVA